MRKRKRPILITGSHRSGTTWIGKTISKHLSVRYVQEPFNVDNPNPLVGLELDTWFVHFESSNQKEEIIKSFNSILQPRPIEFALKSCEVAGLDIKTPLRFLKHLMVESLLLPRVLVKDPLALLSAGWLYETYNFQVICMIRNPFGFVGSLKHAGWGFNFDNLRRQDTLMSGWLRMFARDIENYCLPENKSDFIDRAILLWNVLHFAITDYQRRYPEWLFIKHEDIAKRPDLGFGKIFEYLELGISPGIRKYIEQHTSPQNPTEATGPIYQPRNSKRVITTWKERLSDEEIQRINTKTRDIASLLYGDSTDY